MLHRLSTLRFIRTLCRDYVLLRFVGQSVLQISDMTHHLPPSPAPKFIYCRSPYSPPFVHSFVCFHLSPLPPPPPPPPPAPPSSSALFVCLMTDNSYFFPFVIRSSFHEKTKSYNVTVLIFSIRINLFLLLFLYHNRDLKSTSSCCCCLFGKQDLLHLLHCACNGFFCLFLFFVVFLQSGVFFSVVFLQSVIVNTQTQQPKGRETR